ncbi:MULTISPECIES: hypothetical protein [unclassified Luteococcus]|uniref:hypothetical protein n=1 Tax=unclassified Luteococcus TaxID=2639923 RepID=UPI00313ACB55
MDPDDPVQECTVTHGLSLGIADQFPHRHDGSPGLFARCTGANCYVTDHDHPAPFVGYGPNNPRPRRRRHWRNNGTPPAIDPDTGEPTY